MSNYQENKYGLLNIRQKYKIVIFYQNYIEMVFEMFYYFQFFVTFALLSMGV